MTKSLVGAAVAVLASTVAAGAAAAQTCAGYPTGLMGFYVGARADFPEELNSYGAEAAFNVPGPLGVYAGVNNLSEEGEDVNELFGGVSFEVASLATPILGPSVSACPVGEVRQISEEGVTLTQIPVGLGIGASLGIPGIAADGYVQPRVVFSRLSIDDLGSESETDFGLKAGAMFGLGLVNVGAEVNHIFGNDNDPVFGVRVGIRL